MILCHIDEFALSADGRVAVSGWAVSEAGISSVDLYVDAIDAGAAQIGLPRPDVEQEQPGFAHAGTSGFVLKKHLTTTFDGEHELTVIINSECGDAKLVTLSVTALSVANFPKADVGDRSDDSSIKLFVDRPQIVGNRAKEPIRGGLQVEGWALARDGVAKIDVSIDGAFFETAKYGMRREDVGTSWPDWENSRLSGYALPIPARALPTGEHCIRVELRAHTGSTSHVEFFVETEQPPIENAPWLLRRKMARSQVALTNRILEDLGWRPAIGLMIGMGPNAGDPARLEVTLASLATQVYDDWRALVVGCEGPVLSEILGRYPKLRSRIGTVTADDGGQFSAAFLAVFGKPVPQLIAVASAGDTLGCDALLQIAVESGLHPEADFFYADERRLNPATSTVDAFFKPGWSPDLLMSTNYIGRLWCAETDLLDRTDAKLNEWHRMGEYDLVLRATEQARSIQHIPLVLCERGPPDIDRPAQERSALLRAMRRRRVPGRIADGWTKGYYNICYQPDKTRLVSIVIPVGGKVDLLKACLAGIFDNTSYQHFEVILVYCNNTRTEVFPYLKTVAKRRNVVVVDTKRPFNFSESCNRGADAAKGELLLFLNDDVEVIEPDWLEKLVSHAQRPEVGAVGARLLYPDRKVQHAGMFWVAGHGRHAFRFASDSDPGYFGLAFTTRNVISATGACVMMRRGWFDAIGGFDEAHSVVNNDVDLCLRSWSNGGTIVYEPTVQLIHHELASRAGLPDSYDEDGFENRWGHMLESGDPYYHPVLSRDRDDYSVDEEPVQLVSAGHPLFEKSDINRILVLKLDHLGDFVTAIPAIKHLHARFPEAEIYLLAPPGSNVLARLLPEIKEVINFEVFFSRSGLGERSLTQDDFDSLNLRLAQYRFDLAIDLRKALDTRAILRCSGARWTSGYDRDGRYPWLDVALEWEGDDKMIAKRSHIGDDLIRLVDAVALAAMPERSTMEFSTSDSGCRPSGSAPIVCIHPGVGTETRQWPVEHFATLIDLLVRNDRAEVVIIGGADETQIVEEILAMLTERDPVRSLVGKISLAELPALLASSNLFVGNNSGPQHIAASLGIPSIGIHSGVVDAHEWGPLGTLAVAIRRDMRCSPCYLSHVEQCPRSLACVRELRPHQVYEACKRLLVAKPKSIEQKSNGFDIPRQLNTKWSLSDA